MEFKTLDVKFIGERNRWNKTSYGELGTWTMGEVVWWIIACPRCGEVSWLRTTGDEPKHQIISTEPVHIEPSVGCPHCRAHYFVRNGKVEVLGDF